MRQVAVKRLLHDLKEVLECPLVDVAALPLDDNLFVWHANLRGSEGPLAGVPLHCVLAFPPGFPAAGPEVRLFHALPHPNVAPHPAGAAAAGGAPYRVSYWDCNPSLSHWSPAFTVSSILIQLQAFLLSADLLYDTSKISVERARQAALDLRLLPGHPHQGCMPHPAFPTPEDLSLAPKLRRVEVTAPSVSPELLLHLPTLPAAGVVPRLADPEGWQAAGRRAVRPRAEHGAALAGSSVGGQGCSEGSTPLERAFGLGGFSLLADTEGEALEVLLQQAQRGKHGGSNGGDSERPHSSASSQAGSVAPAPPTPPASSSGTSGGSKEGGRRPRKGLLDSSILKQRDSSLIADVLRTWERRREAEQHGRLAGVQAPAGAATHPGADCRSLDLALPSGSAWDALSPDATLQVLLRLEPRDVAALGCTCRALRAACTDGEVWRALLRRRFPASVLHAAGLGDWRTAYALEANCVLPELRCYFSKANFQDEVLGHTLALTVNPKTRRPDYIAVTAPDLLAAAAYEAGLVRQDPEGNAIMAVLPLFISQTHFERALPHLPALLRQLAPHRAAGLRPGCEPAPEAWLEVLPSMLNTCALLLVDRGLAASERALNCFVALHRLLMALCDQYQLWGAVERRIARFLSSEAERSKEQTPSLGNMLPLLALSRRYDWRDVLPVVLAEAQDRSILWACKADPSLEKSLMRGADAPLDSALLRGAWEAGRVSRRLFQFHAIFLELVARPAGCSLGQVMYHIDSLYGRTGEGLRRRFQAEVKRILEVSSWDGFYDSLGLKPLTPQQQCRALRLSCAASLRKGYHRAGMDFSRVQAGGVSAILLKGQSYTAPPGMKCIAVDERWRSRGSRGGFTYLDASCLIYGDMAAVPPPVHGGRQGSPSGISGPRPGPGEPPFTCPPVAPGGRPLELLGVVDFHTRHGAAVGKQGAVVHSGDLIDGDSGQHTITIKLSELGLQVSCLWLTMSAWAGARLTDVEHPYISVQDPASGAELCQYYLEDVAPQQRAAHSAVVMCCIHRSVRGRGQWEVAAVGALCQGEAGDYAPLLRAIQRLPPGATGVGRQEC